jgi:hypothetical protein
LRRTPVTKTKRYRLADALRVKAELDAMPHHEPEEISLREALTLLSPEIHTLRRKNYGWPAIVAMLAKGGIEVSPSVLKKRLSERRDGAGMKGSRRKAPKDESPRRPAKTTAARSVAMPKSSAATEADVQTDGPVTEGATGGGPTTTFLEGAARGERPHADAATMDAATTTPAGPPPPRATRTTGEAAATTTARSLGSEVPRTTREPVAGSGHERAEDTAEEAPGAGIGTVRPQAVISVAPTAAPKGHPASGTGRPKAGS